MRDARGWRTTSAFKKHLYAPIGALKPVAVVFASVLVFLDALSVCYS